MIYIVVPIHKEPYSVWSTFINDIKIAFEENEYHADVTIMRDRDSFGKGFVIREGFKTIIEKATDDDIIAYIDGDGDILSCELINMIIKIRKENCDIVVGKKKLHNLLLSRKIITILSRIYISIFFNVGVDTQTGVKVFKKKAVFLTEENGFLFDIVMLKKAKENGFKIIEHEVDITNSQAIPLLSVWRSFIQSVPLIYNQVVARHLS